MKITTLASIPISFLIVLFSFSCLNAQDEIKRIQLPALDISQLIQESQEKGYYNQIATVYDIDPVFLKGKDTIINIEVPNSFGIALEYEILNLNCLTGFYIVSDNGDYIDLKEESLSLNSLKGISEFVNSSEISIHLIVDNCNIDNVVKLNKVYPAFIPLNSNDEKSLRSMNDSRGMLDCHVSIACETSRDYTNISTGVTRIRVVHEEGIGFCTGSLIENTRQDNTPYILSAFHCMDGFTPRYDMWRFDFYYQETNCDSDSLSLNYFSVMSCEQKAGWRDSDFLLLELQNEIPEIFDIEFYGWDATDKVPDESYILHHPQGELMKVSIDIDEAIILDSPINWNTGVQTPAFHHFKIDFDSGTQEGGSSGAALFDENDRIVAQLNGGKADCSTFVTYCGRMEKSWEGGGSPETRLKDWLDPLENSNRVFDGRIRESSSRDVIVEIKDINGNAFENAEITIQSTPAQTRITDKDGLAVFHQLDRDSEYAINIQSLNYPVYLGLSGKDVTMLTRHILGLDLIQSPIGLIKADINNDGDINLEDRIKLMNIIVKTDDSIQRNWIYDSSGDLKIGKENEAITIYNIVAHKTGDLNNSAEVD